ncbi:zinc-finger of the MIZ type in Nse subunit-domain-containing protein [Amylostereum chailletii]|nr:zinc-finger of the MIZ type in Nse subunit-domain-containing protein [Amylostereum chailletii]
MALASSRRRTNGRTAQPMDDVIEDPEVSQPGATEDVDMDEDEKDHPRRPGKSQVKLEKVKKEGKRRARDMDEEEQNEDDDQELPVINEETFGNKPIDAHEGQKLQGMAGDWTQIEEHMRNTAFRLMSELAGAVADVLEDQDTKEIKQLDGLMRSIVEIDTELLTRAEALSDLHQAIRAGDEIDDLIAKHNEVYQAKADANDKKTTRQKYSKNEAYIAFRQSIWEVQNPETGMPPVVEFLPKEDGDDSDDDDDIQVGGVALDLKCPLTLTWLAHPVTSTVCKHSFSGAAIQDMLGPNKYTKKMCPAAGCKKMVCLNDFKPDKDLERKVKNAERRRARREEENEAEEIVE